MNDVLAAVPTCTRQRTRRCCGANLYALLAVSVVSFVGTVHGFDSGVISGAKRSMAADLEFSAQQVGYM